MLSLKICSNVYYFYSYSLIFIHVFSRFRVAIWEDLDSASHTWDESKTKANNQLANGIVSYLF